MSNKNPVLMAVGLAVAIAGLAVLIRPAAKPVDDGKPKVGQCYDFYGGIPTKVTRVGEFGVWVAVKGVPDPYLTFGQFKAFEQVDCQ